jgi:RNA polymerase sigma-70 factor (ECF subfamily)
MAQDSTAEALLARVAERDEEALGGLYGQFAPALLGMALQILPERNAAEEVVEDVFLRLWNEARRLSRQPGSVAAWLTVVCRRAAIDRHRGERKLPPLWRGGIDSLHKFLFWLPRPEEIALVEERCDLLRKVVSQLPKSQRSAQELAVFGGFTEAEIAEKLGEPLGKVKSGLRAGLRFLRHRMRAVMGTWSADI